MNILLPVSRGASFDDAVRLAIDTAKAHAGRIRVLSVVDAAEIRRIEAGARPGAIHLALHAAEEVRKRMTAEGTAAVAGVLRRCEEAGVPAHGEVVEGELERELLSVAGANDLLVSATASHFDPDLEDASGQLVLTVMREGGSPSCSPELRIVPRARSSPAAGEGPGPSARWGRWPGSPFGRQPPGDPPRRGRRPGRGTGADRRPAADPRGRRLSGVGGENPPGPRAPTFLSFCYSVAADVVILGGWASTPGMISWTDDHWAPPR